MAYWLFQPEVWIILGILLIAAELLDGSTIFFLPFGLGSLFNAVLVGQQANASLPGFLTFDQWWQMLISWAVFALLALALLRVLSMLRKKRAEPDVNEY